MKFFSILTSFVFVLLVATANADTKTNATEETNINKHKIIIPIKNQNHWVRITEKNDGKESIVTVQTKEGENGKVETKRYKVKSKKPGAGTYVYKEYSEHNYDDANSGLQLDSKSRQQQHYLQGVLAHTHAEIAAQMIEMNRQMKGLQKQVEKLPSLDSHFTFSESDSTSEDIDNAPKPTTEKLPWWKVLLRKLAQ